MPKRSQTDTNSTALATLEPKTVSKTKLKRRISIQDVEAIADMVADRLTEAEACKLLNINHGTWRDWKLDHKHDETFSDSLTRVKASKIRGCMQGIKAAGPKDWRAYDRLLQLTDARFRDKDPSTSGVVVVDTMILEALKRVYGAGSNDLQALPAGDSRALPPTSSVPERVSGKPLADTQAVTSVDKPVIDV